ncbi:MAG: hypothetical protein V4587_08915 [Acidobacteriota bacterium]
MKLPLVAIVSWILVAWSFQAAHAGVEQLATYRGPGAIDGAVVGPGPTSGSERLYLAYMYVNRTVDLVSVDPASGKWQTFENPAKSEFGAIMALGPDGNIYLGTRAHAHIYRLNPRTNNYQDLGQPAPGEAYIYGLVTGSDGKLYGCTYPSAKLVRYDPASGKSEDLGRMDPKENYAKSIAASDDGFVYTGIGAARAHLVAYQISTGKHRDILPASAENAIDQLGQGSIAIVHKGKDGRIYAVAGKQYFVVKDWVAREIPEKEMQAAASTTLLKDGRDVTVDGNELVIHKPGSINVERIPYTYSGREGVAFRIGAGPDGHIYGSSVLPFHLFSVDVDTKQLKDFGYLGVGEAYSLVPFDGKLYIAAYDGVNKAPLMAFDPVQHFAPGTSADSNPLLITYDGADTGWRPEAMVQGPDKKFYIGSVAGYGSVSGPLTIFDPRTGQVTKFSDVVPGESVVSLTAAKDLIIGGTSISGGGGSHATEHEAKLFLWDALHNRKTYETVPVPAATEITDLLALPEDKVMGIAIGVKPDLANPASTSSGGNSRLFVFDLHSRKVDYTVPINLHGIIFNSVALGPDHSVWGLAQDGIFRFDPRTHRLQLEVNTPEPVTAGFALLNGNLYYASSSVIYRYALPNGLNRPNTSSGGGR